MANRFDTFDRADSTTSLGTPSDGGSAWVAQAGTWGIASNRGRNVSGGGTESARLDGGEAVVNVAADFPALAGGDCGFILRAADASNYWQMRIRTSTSQLLIRKTVAGSTTTEQTTSSITAANADTWEFDVDSSNNYRCYRTPSGGPRAQINVTYAGGTDLAANTGVGLFAQSDNISRWDNFAATGAEVRGSGTASGSATAAGSGFAVGRVPRPDNDGSRKPGIRVLDVLRYRTPITASGAAAGASTAFAHGRASRRPATPRPIIESSPARKGRSRLRRAMQRELEDLVLLLR